MKGTRCVWQEAFDKAIDEGESEFFASKAGDEAVADFISERDDRAYDAWRDRKLMNEEAY